LEYYFCYTGLGSTGVPPHEMILYNQYRGIISAAQANASLDSLASINNIEQIGDLWYRNAALMNHSISISGGGRVTFFLRIAGLYQYEIQSSGRSKQFVQSKSEAGFYFQQKCPILSDH